MIPNGTVINAPHLPCRCGGTRRKVKHKGGAVATTCLDCHHTTVVGRSQLDGRSVHPSAMSDNDGDGIAPD